MAEIELLENDQITDCHSVDGLILDVSPLSPCLCVCYVGCCQQFGQEIAGCNLLFSRFRQERLFRRFAEAMLCG